VLGLELLIQVQRSKFNSSTIKLQVADIGVARHKAYITRFKFVYSSTHAHSTNSTVVCVLVFRGQIGRLEKGKGEQVARQQVVHRITLFSKAFFFHNGLDAIVANPLLVIGVKKARTPQVLRVNAVPNSN
jgi:hypothetical protein